MITSGFRCPLAPMVSAATRPTTMTDTITIWPTRWRQAAFRLLGSRGQDWCDDPSCHARNGTPAARYGSVRQSPSPSLTVTADVRTDDRLGAHRHGAPERPRVRPKRRRRRNGADVGP